MMQDSLGPREVGWVPFIQRQNRVSIGATIEIRWILQWEMTFYILQNVGLIFYFFYLTKLEFHFINAQIDDASLKFCTLDYLFVVLEPNG